MDRLMVGISGVRGTVGRTLTQQVAREFGQAFGAMLGAGKTVVMGRDTRPSGPMIRNAVSAGLLAAGLNVIDLGVVSTPGVALMTGKLHAGGGVVITASHNPAQYNGIKFLQPTGTALNATSAGRLKRTWEAGEFALADAGDQGVETCDSSTHGRHVDAVCAVVEATGIAAKRFKVVLDSINGAGCVVAPMLLGRLGCEVVHLNAEPNGQFAHTPEPVEQNLTQLCEAVREHRASVGFAQDPDADRLAIVDETGRFIGEEYTLALTAAFVLRHRKGKVAANLSTSRMIDDIASTTGCEVVRTPTGEANVVEGMQQAGCIFGGEGGGGIIEPRVVPVRDSLVAMAYVLGYLAETNQPVSRLVDQIPRYVMIKTKLPCAAGMAKKVEKATRRAFASRRDARFNDADGLRIDLPDRWVSVRASNTEPIMRIVAEAREEKPARALIAEVRRIADGLVNK